MGFCCAKLCYKLFGEKEKRILMIGLAGSGKTTICYKIKFGETVKTIPTIGFNVETLFYNGLSFTIWDVGGQDKIRVLWKHYYSETDGLIFVIDSSDADGLDDAVEELKKMLVEEELKKCPLLVLANKIDLERRFNTYEIKSKIEYEIPSIQEKTWHVQGTSGFTGEGIKEGFDWLASSLLKKK